MVRIRIRTKQSDSDLYKIEKQDPDPYQSEKQDPGLYVSKGSGSATLGWADIAIL